MSWIWSCLPGLAAQFQLHRDVAEISYGLLIDELHGEEIGVTLADHVWNRKRNA